MKYVAIHYVKVAGRMYSPGEIFSVDVVAPEKIERLLAKGAIRKFPGDADATATAEKPAKKPTAVKAPDTDEGDDEPADDEGEDDEDAPEIDAMDGVVQPEPAAKPAQKPAAKPKTTKPKAAAGRGKK